MRAHVIRLLIMSVGLGAFGSLAHKVLPGRYWPLCGLLLVSIAFICITRIMRSRTWQNIGIGVYSVLLAITAIEASALVFEPKPETTFMQTPSDGFSDNPITGWGPAHPGVIHATKTDAQTGETIFDAQYTIDNQLLRKTVSAESGDTIAFFGDSWTFGVGVDDADTLPQSFADQTNQRFKVLNFGYSGYGPEQFLRMLETGSIDHIIKGKQKLFVFTTFAFQAGRTACKEANGLRAPRYEIDTEGQVSFAGFCATGFRRAWLEFALHTGFYRRYFQSDAQKLQRPDVALYMSVLKRAVNLAKTKYGVPSLIIYDRTGDDYLQSAGLTNDDVVTELRHAGLAILEMDIQDKVSAGVTTSFPHDGHPTAIAQHARATVLKDYLEANLPSLAQR